MVFGVWVTNLFTGSLLFRGKSHSRLISSDRFADRGFESSHAICSAASQFRQGLALRVSQHNKLYRSNYIVSTGLKMAFQDIYLKGSTVAYKGGQEMREAPASL